MNFSQRQELEGFIAAPPLWTSSQLFGLEQFSIPEVSLPQSPDLGTKIPGLLPNLVMGKRMERFFSYILNNSRKYKIVGENIQIITNKITLGELDFLIEDIEEYIYYHIELVFKFYLYDPAFNNEYERWIGPNRKDSLFQKIDRLKENQLPLLYSPKVKMLLDDLNINIAHIQQKVCFKAWLFVPLSYRKLEITGINQKCIAGCYIPYIEFTESKFGSWEFYAPGKKEWPIDPKYNNKWFTYVEIVLQIEELLNRNRSPLLWIKKGEFVYERLFIVWW